MQNYTAVSNQTEKIDTIEHVNQDHEDMVLAIAQVQLPSAEIESAELTDIYEEAVSATVTLKNGALTTVYVPFEIKGSLEERLQYLAYTAMAMQGKSLADNRRQFFEVIEKQQLTPHLLRLTIKSQTPLPANSPAYAYGFVMKTLEKMPTVSKAGSTENSGLLHHYWQRLLLWGMKKLPQKQRHQVMNSWSKDIRYYTLQTAWQSADSDFADCGYVDVFLHGETSGSQWAKQLQSGDVISARVETDDKHDNLHQGQALLIADETAYPAVLGLLQQWQNPIAPYVIILSATEAEQQYFTETALKGSKQAFRMVCPPNEQGEQVIAVLKTLVDVETVWGALEKDAAKTVRAYCRNYWQLAGKDNRIKGYWRL